MSASHRLTAGAAPPKDDESQRDTGFRLDRAALRRHFDRAADRDDAEVLGREIASRMAERLDYIRLAPRRVLDLGCGRGADLPALAARYPEASVLAADLSPRMLARANANASGGRADGFGSRLLRRLRGGGSSTFLHFVADAGALPLRPGSLDLVWSNLMLPAVDDPLPVFAEVQRSLAVGGLLMFSTLGPDTLRELRAALPARRGERVHRFIDMHDLGDALVRAGFADPVMDMEMLTLTYASLDDLLADLRASGASNAASARPRGLSGRREWADARAVYETRRRDGRLPATFEIIQGHAWKPAPRNTADGRSIVRFHRRTEEDER